MLMGKVPLLLFTMIVLVHRNCNTEFTIDTYLLLIKLIIVKQQKLNL